MPASDYIEWLDFPDPKRQWAQSMQFQLSRTATMDPSALRSIQLAALKRLLAHSVATVPFYDERCYRDALSAPSPRAFAEDCEPYSHQI